MVASARSAFHSNSSNLQQQLQTPLSERSVVDEVPAAQVAAWRDTALRAAQQSSSAFTGPDDPSFSDLQVPPEAPGTLESCKLSVSNQACKLWFACRESYGGC